MEVTEALASCLLATGQQCEANQMNEQDSQEALLKEFQRCMHQIVQSALGRAGLSNEATSYEQRKRSTFNYLDASKAFV